jgi:hypothetical protein
VIASSLDILRTELRNNASTFSVLCGTSPWLSEWQSPEMKSGSRSEISVFVIMHASRYQDCLLVDPMLQHAASLDRTP